MKGLHVMTLAEKSFSIKVPYDGATLPELLGDQYYEKDTDERLGKFIGWRDINTNKIYSKDSILSNAHCDFINQLVNTGLLGCITYFGLFSTSAVRFFKSKNPLLIILGICICSYLIFNIFSFQQIYNTTHIYLLLGIGEAVRRKTN